ncbi:metallophosphoesterase family protein [Clostridium neonatale]|uniref:metallophosphoesterase family protein n=1 Tax=Clostridium neonatale TaxID=137838 RepID=UPI00291C3AF0|nr:metallophosphoesterase [Clostridium neonatale]CAI3202390.1 Metallophosphoesterase [Clostridium neonatale]CAI3211181.1 Metallophosphoesterase [Clostridium neonatale]
MYILQLSDFHINNAVDLNEYKDKIDKMYDSSKDILEENEEIIFCICGDITDQGSKEGYENAIKVIDYIKEKFIVYNYKFEFIPGNHDICEGSFDEIDKCISRYTEKEYTYEKNNVVVRLYDGINLILLNTSYHKDYKYGKIDFVELEEKLKNITDGKNFVVMHHTFISEYETDQSAIRDAYKFIKLLEKYNVCALLHGHTHGYSDITIAKECKVIGVGPLFKKQDDINTQFNIIKVNSSQINNIYNMRYNSDLNRYTKVDVFSRTFLNYFNGYDLKETYEKVVQAIKEYGAIINFNMNIRTELQKFNESIEHLFYEQIKIAEEWQEKVPPSSLYYNHGEYMFKGKVDPINHIIKELIRKPTSSRAIIPLINMNDVVDSGDNFLPSLDIIQFGFDNDERIELCVTIYLRALEVNNFLKINLCEVYVMCKKIKEQIRSISNININIFAFRAQYKEKFSCFKKADIDITDESRIMIKVMKKKVEQIIELLKNKYELSETVVHLDGIDKLDRCIKNYNDDCEEEESYPIKIVEGIGTLKECMNKLKKLREKTSDYKEIEEQEEIVQKGIKCLINEFEKLLEE